MEQSLGKKIAAYRKQRGMTQDELAEQLQVSPQAVSKWENDQSCPDIMLLATLAQILGTTTDDLLSAETKPEIQLLPEGKRKTLNELILKVIVNSKEGDKVRINLPMMLVKVGLEMGMNAPQFSGKEYLKDIDLNQLLTMVESGVVGKLVEVESADGDIVEIVVE